MSTDYFCIENAPFTSLRSNITSTVRYAAAASFSIDLADRVDRVLSGNR
jgi:hypothetical protein